MVQKSEIKREDSWKLNVKQSGKTSLAFYVVSSKVAVSEKKKITAWYEYTHALKVPMSIGSSQYVGGFKRTIHI